MNANERFWDRVAEQYAKKPIANPAAYQRKLEITKSFLDRRHVVLDVGCGTGSLAIELAPHVARVHAVDVSAEMIRIGRRKAEARGIENITFHQATTEALPHFEADSLDGVCAYSILHLVRDRSLVLEQLARLLKPGGVFISSTMCLRNTPHVPYGLFLPLMYWLGKAPAVQLFSTPQLMDEIRHAGFTNVSTHEVGAKETVAFVVAHKPE